MSDEEPSTFVMAGGGTGGHVIPAIAVACELRDRGDRAVFIGTDRGFEATLVPNAGFEIEWIEVGALNRIGLLKKLRTVATLPGGLLRCWRLLGRYKARAVFSMGGYVAGPVVLAAILRKIPVLVMEPNAMPGMTNRRIGRFVAKALLSFEEARRYFPAGRTEITGLPVRREFFEIPDREPGDVITVLITGGSRGARSLNRAVREAWPYFADGIRVRLLHQTGREAFDEIEREFAATGLQGSVKLFIDDMPAAFAEADLVVCRSGAGAVAELAAAGKPSILIPFPFAADDHQLYNAQAFVNAGAACLIPDAELSGKRFYEEVRRLADHPGELKEMGRRARAFAHPDAARRAADLLEELAGRH